MTARKVLIVDDEADIRELLEITLGRMKLETIAAADLATALGHLGETSFDLCLTDINLPDGNGLDLVSHIVANYPDTPIAVITAYGSTNTAIDAMKRGAFDYIQKPLDLGQLRGVVESALKIKAAATGPERETMVGDSPAMRAIREQIVRLARSQAPVYISGESGCGKELAARRIHDLGPRSQGPFVPVNCGAIPAELVESEFFGHVRGSFTGATADKPGLFQAARGGTLFLDEVADLPLAMQVKLLRAIQEKAVRPVGSTEESPTDVRIVSATHRNLEREVAEGRFRQDLFYRLNVIELVVPSLRSRREDILPLANHILARLAERYGVEPPALTAAARTILETYDFPGNVRELENMLERAITLAEGGRIDTKDLRLASPSAVPDKAPDLTVTPPQPTDFRATSAQPTPAEATGRTVTLGEMAEGQSLEDHLADIERSLINQALEESRWNRTAAARRLGITFRALRYRLKKLGLE